MASKKKRVGRPRTSGPRNVPVSVSLSETVLSELRAIADRQGVALSALVQRAVDRWLKTKEAKR